MLLKNIQIENFRSFEHYKVENLARVNLFVGDNNSGKTSVLEAIRFLVAQGRLQTLFSIMRERGEYESDSERRHSYRYKLQSLFSSANDPHFDIELADSRELEIRATYAEPVQAVEQIVKLGVKQAKGFGNPRLHSTSRLHSSKIDIDLRQDSADLNDDLTAQSPTGYLKNHSDDLDAFPFFRREPNYLSISVAGEQTGQLASLWTKVLESRREQDVLKAINLIVEDCSDIHFAPSASTKSHVFLDVAGKRRPLAEFGGGTASILAIASGLGYCANGYLFVDEIDTGLHFSRLADVWRMVITTARELDVQVFATTHSQDCLRALADAIDADDSLTDEDVALFSIDRRVDYAVRFDKKGIVITVDHEIEVR